VTDERFEPEPETLGKRLRRLRLERDLSQRDLESPGVSYAYISRLESETRTASVKAIRKLSEGLGVTPNYLEFGEEIDPLVRALLRRIRRLERKLGIPSTTDASGRLGPDALERDEAGSKQDHPVAKKVSDRRRHAPPRVAP
jgi:transcriptional regulator with XRE-family HTH domain